MVSLDWLSLSLESEVAYGGHQETSDAEMSAYTIEPSDTRHFLFEKRPYGTKQYRSIWNVSYVDEDGAISPFCTFSAEPTLSSWSARCCSLKVENSFLYADNRGSWINVLQLFLETYQCKVHNITRADIAGDFLYLYNRTSGAQLAQRIKSCEWWKCGSSKVSEHYMLPYSLKWQREYDNEGYDLEVYQNGDHYISKVESMTFGTMASDVQVSLYDKTLELNAHSIKNPDCEDADPISYKEYIRDCHKVAGVWHEKRHTWRLEFRVRNNACFVFDPELGQSRPLCLSDLTQHNLNYIYVALQQKYFRLVDATNGGTRQVDDNLFLTMRDHKNRLAPVKLFEVQDLKIAMVKKKHHLTANRYNRAVINRLDTLSKNAGICNGMYTNEGDSEKLFLGVETIKALSLGQEPMQKECSHIVRRLSALLVKIKQRKFEVPSESIQSIIDAKNVLERHLKTESPKFSLNVAMSLEKFAKSLDLSKFSSDNVIRQRTIYPTDSQILSDAASILRGIYSNTLLDQRLEDNRNIYKEPFIELLGYVREGKRLNEAEFNNLKLFIGKNSPIPSDMKESLMMFYGGSDVQALQYHRDYSWYSNWFDRREAQSD